ncbi:MAG: glucose-6-phosphate isomerase [Cyanothece sp. SIO2G6]|nr:glucose-6-phosphate isomerase [Cyanothece sp. SIO2G6]
MDAAALWQRYQDWLYYSDALGFYIDISRMSFTDEDVASLQPKFEKAFADMVALEQGAIANPDENRMVGHYWLRDANLAPSAELKQDITETLNAIKTFAQKIHDGEVRPPQAQLFTDVLSIGIGGSALGPQFVAQALAPVNPNLSLHFVDNTDPDGIDRVVAKLKERLSSTLVITISKSGGTPETRNGMLEVKSAFEKRGLNFSQQAIAVTGMGSKLDEQAKREGWLARFPMHDWVGGRTSEMSAVGLLPAALQGIDIQAMLDGAKAMDELTRVPSLKENPAALLTLAWYTSGQGKGLKDMVILPYKDSLLLFSRYLQQLVMESLGKEKDLDGNTVYQGIAVYGNKGSTDQHAYVQQLREGVNNFFMTFIEVLRDREGDSCQVENGVTSGDYLSGLLQGTRQALFENQRESVTVTIPMVNAYNVGALIALYERTVSFYASLVNINAYHQPGVEAGKKAAASVLDLQRQIVAAFASSNSNEMSLTQLVEVLQCPDQIESVYKIVRHLAANQRQLDLKGDLSKPASLMVTTI